MDVVHLDTASTPDTAPPPPDAAVVPDAPPANGPALHWRFDEPSGTTALDSSGNGYHGTYSGYAGGVPMTSGSVPAVMFTDPASRAFTASQRHQVRLANPPAALMPSSTVTVAAWFKMGTIDASGYGLLVDVSGGLNITLAANAIWQARDTGTAGLTYCTANVNSLTDNQWHHVAAVWTPTTMNVYLDGTERCTNNRGGNIDYDGVADGVVVGRRTGTSNALSVRGQHRRRSDIHPRPLANRDSESGRRRSVLSGSPLQRALFSASGLPPI